MQTTGFSFAFYSVRVSIARILTRPDLQDVNSCALTMPTVTETAITLEWEMFLPRKANGESNGFLQCFRRQSRSWCFAVHARGNGL